MELDPVYASAIVRRFVAYRGNTEDVHIIRDGKTLPCSEVYIPTAEDLGMKDTIPIVVIDGHHATIQCILVVFGGQGRLI